jgi:hypothetical protein
VTMNLCPHVVVPGLSTVEGDVFGLSQPALGLADSRPIAPV